MKNVIGIDPSSKKLAMCIASEGQFQLDVINLPAGLYSATGAAYREVFCFLESLNGSAYVYMESPLVGVGGVHSTVVQAQVGGAVMAAVRNSATPLHMVNVGTWKKQVLGKGNAKKPEVAEWLEKNWPAAYHEANGDQDLIDAACISRYGVLHERLLARKIRGRKVEGKEEVDRAGLRR
jgi:Holliday junction resolvasome RuvABC endonuclease subunit